MIEEFVLKLLAKAAEEAIATLEISGVFGRTLSGRLKRLEIQTLFHGNTRDQNQI